MWIIPRSLQSNGALARVEIISDSGGFCRDCASSLLVRSKLMRAPTWSQKWRRDSWMRLLFGRTAAPSPATFSAIGSHFSSLPILARGRAARGCAAAPPIRAGSGRGCAKPSPRCGRSAAFLKTSRVMSAKVCGLSSRIWDAWVTAERGDYSARRKSARRTGGNGFSSWPTARVEDSESCGNHPRSEGDSLTGASARAETLKAKGVNGNGAGTPLTIAAKQWTTPQAHDVTQRGAGQAPCAKAGNACLARDAATWPTPSVQDSANNAGPSQHTRNTPPLNTAVLTFHPAPATSTPGAKSSPASRVLNPRFVEWLMGWPIGWTDCASAETASCPIPPPSPGSPSTPASAPAR